MPLRSDFTDASPMPTDHAAHHNALALAVNAGGSGSLTPTASQTGNYTASAGQLVLANAIAAGFTVTLPAAPATGAMVGVKKTDTSANTVTVVGAGVTTIDQDPSATLTSQDSAATFVFDGTNWQVASTAILNASGAGGSSEASTSDVVLSPLYTSGCWYSRRSGTQAMFTIESAGNRNLATSTIFYVPQFLHKSVTISRVALAIGSSAPTAGSVLRLGLYTTNSTTGLPATLIPGGDMGSVVLGTTASVISSTTLASTLAIPKGWVWWALSVNSVATVVVTGLSGTSQVPTQLQGITDADFTYTNVSGNFLGYNLGTGVGNSTAAALTANPPVTLSRSNSVPEVYFKVA